MFFEKIFSDIDILFEYCLNNNILEMNRNCPRCGGDTILKLYKKHAKQIIIYRCCNQNCRRKIPITNTKLKITQLVHIIFLILSGTNYKQLYWYFGVSDKTIYFIKKKLQKCYEFYINKRPILLGGFNKIVEADETVLSRRGIIRYPTSTDDEAKDTVWIFGAIDENDKQNFLLKRIKNRKTDTITNVLEGKIGVCSKFHTDGYPSYPGVAENLCLKHKLVDHSKGFKSLDGTHTNNIEGFWAHLKGTMRKEHGVMRKNIDNWILEYTFKRRFLMNSSKEEFEDVFSEILKLYFSYSFFLKKKLSKFKKSKIL
ncbi:hypothetical protein EQH57_0073 [Dictyocoela roeselum]|nr:hypothetical protein EQH57_0073 [Dictyocoela roeselum]